MFRVDQTLLIRALNSTRQIYFPSYVGLRLIGNQMSLSEENYLHQLIRRRLFSGDAWRYKPFKLYKGSIQTQQGFDHQYRNCLAPSPLTAITESFILKMLAESPAFQVSPRVYSYRWPPSSRSGVNYRYFFDGYKQRNIEIAAALDALNHVAVVTDLKQFYPSAKKEQVESVLKSRLGRSKEQFGALSDAIYGFYSQLLATSSEGIPVGPVSGHILGHLVLQDVDSELTSKYGDNYFRYVDDIVVVCHENDVDAVKRGIQNSIEKHGFSINPDKTAEITREVWHHNILRTDVSDEDSLRLLTSDMATYLVFHPERADELSKMFSDAGLCIPVGRLHDLSKHNRFRYFISRWSARSGLSHAFSLYLSKNNHFVQRGLRLKSIYENSLSKLIEEPLEISPNLRRWQVQRSRRLINSLFYLRRFNDWNTPDGAFDAFPELIEQRALANSLATGKINSILPFYGNGPAAFSELWAEHGEGYATLLPSESGISSTELDGVITLRLCGIISAESMQFLQNIKNERLLQTIIQPILIARTKPDLTFDDEFESLCLGVSDQEIAKLAKTRYALSEGNVLEALSLISSEYRS